MKPVNQNTNYENHCNKADKKHPYSENISDRNIFLLSGIFFNNQPQHQRKQQEKQRYNPKNHR